LLDGKTADARSDVFSLGVVMHELLSGRQLFVGDNDLDTLRLVREMDIPPPSARNPGVKRTLDAVVMRALERDPAKRFQSAGEMGDALETIVMRERYSSRALARKARELAERQEPGQPSGASVDETIEVVDSGSLMLSESGAVAVPARVVHSGSTPVIDESASPRRPTTPPRVPAAATAATAAAAAASSAPARAAAAAPRRWTWVAVALPSALALVLFGALLRRPSTAPLPVPVISPTVRVVVDSTPQGAAVALEASASAGRSGGSALGETPVLIDLPRGQAPVELLITKTGFTPLSFRVLPHQDREVLARLEALPPPPPPVAVAPVLPLGRPLGARHGSALGARRSQLGLSGLRPNATVGAAPGGRAGTVPAAAPAATAARPGPASALMRR
jgi:eukaryotic-like serine/threonine-protein kinase